MLLDILERSALTAAIAYKDGQYIFPNDEVRRFTAFFGLSAPSI
jgi:hypothetical protein